jgi:hypothetical protein
VDLGDHYLEGQLFYHKTYGISGLIRSFNGKYFAVSSDFCGLVFKTEYSCLGLPSSDWLKETCSSNTNLAYKTIEFTALKCSGEDAIEIVGLYYDASAYAACLETEELSTCPGVTIVVSKK